MTDPTEVTPDLLRGWPLPDAADDKESRGRVLVVGGSRSTPGAVVLAGEAALRAGAGKLRIATVAANAPALGVALPEARVAGLPESEEGSLAATGAETVLELADGCAAVLLGPGFVDLDASVALLRAVVPRLTTTVVLDALASGFVTPEPEALRDLPGEVVLTLNPGELAHAAGVPPEQVRDDQAGTTAELAERTRSTVLCGGTEKTVAAGGRSWLVRPGGAGLAVSGSGDTQAGIVAGLAARGAGPAQAAVWGGYLHGAAGERLAHRVGELGFLAREIAPEVPALLRDLGGS